MIWEGFRSDVHAVFAGVWNIHIEDRGFNVGKGK